jgi:dihydrofolate reductase
MRKLIVSSLVSLDGIYGDPQSWAGDYFDEQAAAQSLAVLLDSDAMLMGRKTYEYFVPAFSSPSGRYLEQINEMRKYVFSSTLTAADWNNTTIIPGDPVAAAAVRAPTTVSITWPMSRAASRWHGQAVTPATPTKGSPP